MSDPIFYVCDSCGEPVGSQAFTQLFEYYDQRQDVFRRLTLAFCAPCSGNRDNVEKVILETMAQLHAEVNS